MKCTKSENLSDCRLVLQLPLANFHWSQVLSWEWRCSWSSADRRCSNYIWVINNSTANSGATYIRGLTVHIRKLTPLCLRPIPKFSISTTAPTFSSSRVPSSFFPASSSLLHVASSGRHQCVHWPLRDLCGQGQPTCLRLRHVRAVGTDPTENI